MCTIIQKKIKNIIHIAGTNGKGSVLAFLKAFLKSGNYSVNTYSSPHLISFNERINLNGKNISNLNKYYREVSGIYWIWKNRLNDKDTNDWIGNCGYRKLWLNSLYDKKQKLSFDSLYSNLLNPDNKIFENCDVFSTILLTKSANDGTFVDPTMGFEVGYMPIEAF